MEFRTFALIAALLVGACSTGEPPPAQRPGDRCLYGVEAEYGRIMQWGSCAHPPPYSIRVGGPN